MKKQMGFTLIEILIAVVIFAVLGVLAAVGLRSVLRTHEHIKKADAQLQQTETTVAILRRDVSQIIERSIINASGNVESPVLSEGPETIAFTRAGFVNPGAIAQRSQMQRVEYTVKKNQLLRLTWPALDQAPNSQPMETVLLKGVANLQIQYLDSQNQLMNSWPLASGSNADVNNQNQSMPKAIVLTIDLVKKGEMRLVLPVPAKGVASNATG